MLRDGLKSPEPAVWKDCATSRGAYPSLRRLPELHSQLIETLPRPVAKLPGGSPPLSRLVASIPRRLSQWRRLAWEPARGRPSPPGLFDLAWAGREAEN